MTNRGVTRLRNWSFLMSSLWVGTVGLLHNLTANTTIRCVSVPPILNHQECVITSLRYIYNDTYPAQRSSQTVIKSDRFLILLLVNLSQIRFINGSNISLSHMLNITGNSPVWLKTTLLSRDKHVVCLIWRVDVCLHILRRTFTHDASVIFGLLIFKMIKGQNERGKRMSTWEKHALNM